MANVIQIQSNFTAGEISPRLMGRADLNKYNNGARTIQNALVQSHGGLTRRPGTKYVDAIASATHVPRLAEFHYNTEQSYVLEVGVDTADGKPGDTTADVPSSYYGATDPGGDAYTVGSPDAHGYIRFFRLDSSGEPIRINIEKQELPWVDVELPKLTFVQSADTLFIFCPTRPVLKFQRIGIDTVVDNWEHTVLEGATDGFVDGPYLDTNVEEIYFQVNGLEGAGVYLTVTNADDSEYQSTSTDGVGYFTEADIGRVVRLEDPAEGYKVIGFTHGPNVSTGALVTCAGVDLSTASGGNNCEVEFFDFVRGPTVLDDTLHMAKGILGSTSATSFRLHHANTGDPELYAKTGDFDSGQIDGFVRISPATHTGWGVITAVNQLGQDLAGSGATYNTAVVTVKKKFISIERTKNWRLGAWSKQTGYPQNGVFHQNRLWAASTATQPQTLWASETNVYNTYSPTDLETGQVVNSQALSLTLASRHVNGINGMKSDTQGLMIFTTGGEWLGRSSALGAPITPTDLSFTKQTAYGSTATLEPIRMGHSYLVFQRDATTLREFTYEFASDKFVAPNLTLLSEHIAKDGVVDGTFQFGATPRVWFVTATGDLLAFTYDKLQEVAAWTKCILGASGSGLPAGEAISCSRTIDGTVDNVWLLVKRKIGSGTENYYIEMLTQDFETSDDHKDAIFLDSASVQSTGTPKTDWDGLAHLNGEVVYVLADSVSSGPYTVNAVVSNGIRLAANASNVTIGLKYKTTVETVPLNVNQNVQFKSNYKRAIKSFLNMYRSISGQFGINDDTADNLLYDIEYPTAVSSPPELRTAMVEFSVPGLSERELILRFEQEDAHPSNLLSIVSEVSLGS